MAGRSSQKELQVQRPVCFSMAKQTTYNCVAIATQYKFFSFIKEKQKLDIYFTISYHLLHI